MAEQSEPVQKLVAELSRALEEYSREYDRNPELLQKPTNPHLRKLFADSEGFSAAFRAEVEKLLSACPQK